MSRPDSDLSSHLLCFIDALDTCFDSDSGHTQDIPFDDIADALLGKEPDNPSCNIRNLAYRSRILRDALVMAISSEIRHHGKGICLS